MTLFRQRHYFAVIGRGLNTPAFRKQTKVGRGERIKVDGGIHVSKQPMIVPAGGSEHGASPSELQSIARLPARCAKFRQSKRFQDVNGSGRRGRGIYIFWAAR